MKCENKQNQKIPGSLLSLARATFKNCTKQTMRIHFAWPKMFWIRNQKDSKVTQG
jgi:hypothetical protein